MEETRKAHIKHAYNHAAERYARELFYELYSKPLDVKLLDLFVERVNPTGKICEIGCGPGEISTYLKYKGLDLIGIDISEEMIQQAKTLNPSIDFRVGDVFALNFSDDTFSGVLAPFLFVNFPLEDIGKALQEIKRVLQPNGLFYASFHAGQGSLAVQDFFHENNPLDFYLFSAEEIEDVLKQYQFEVIEWIVRSPYKSGEHPNKRGYIFSINRK